MASRLRQITVDLAFIAGLCTLSLACDGAKVPERPAESTGTSVGGKSEAAAEDQADDADEQGAAAPSEPAEPAADKPDDSPNDGETEPANATYQRGGAAVGDAAMIEAVKACLKQNHIYDRFTGAGECSTVSAAKLDCNEAGIKKILSEKQAQQFDESIAGSYAGWSLDQCADCPANDTSNVCLTTGGERQVGTKVLFVKVVDNQAHGKSMLLPMRPYQPKE